MIRKNVVTIASKIGRPCWVSYLGEENIIKLEGWLNNYEILYFPHKIEVQNHGYKKVAYLNDYEEVFFPPSNWYGLGLNIRKILNAEGRSRFKDEEINILPPE